MEFCMFRRQVLKKGGIAAIGAVTLSSGVVSANNRSRNPPNDNVPSAEVSAFGFDEVQDVSTGEWIVHRIGWISPTEDAVHEALEKMEIRAWLDGEEITDADSYWGDTFVNDDDIYQAEWQYTTPPRSPGEYKITIRIEFTEDYSEDWSEGDYIVTTGDYKVS